KEVINREKKTQEDWMKKYNYLTGEYFKQVLVEECKKAGLPFNTFEGKKLSNSMMEKIPFSLKASSAIPKTSSALIGWRSSILENNLEYVGPFYVSPLTTLEPPLESDGFQIKKQRFIILG
ncbi:uncharacterized protein LOC122510169, partial [Leptopilina heterotoma]|uniref:uncharacterized protein LOC122510169 n=1 Tax=Leptopilina heterotoma TaxID=63436 RepID=UPI001CA988D5